MKVCLRMVVDNSLRDLFHLQNLDLQAVCTDIVRAWKAENYLNMVQNCSLMIEEHEDRGFTLLVFLEIAVQALLEAVSEHLENRLMFDLAVIYHQRSGGDRCHLRDLRCETLLDRLE